jgi:adenylate cyclase
VVDYSRLMGDDQSGAMDALRQLRAELFEPIVENFCGSIVKRMGDGWIVEFPSISDAVSCAIDIQTGLESHDLIRLRMGIHIGEVVFEHEDVFGDGVNVAARLETLASPSQLLISDTAYNSLDTKTGKLFRGGGTHQLKNISRPVTVWAWSLSDLEIETILSKNILALPDKPSLAVLPFDNMSGDPDQEYFSDGLTEDIITGLSCLRWLFVIARNSSFTYKNKAMNVTQIGQELGVRYVLEGSVRKAHQRVRVTAQLVEAATGTHIWAERYDRELADIFELQDELTEAISSNVNAELAISERNIAHRKPDTNLDAWDCFQRGMWHLYKLNRESISTAKLLFQEACDLAPEFANSRAAYGYVADIEAVMGYCADTRQTLTDGLHHAEKAVAIDDRDSFNHYVAGRIATTLGDKEKAISSLEKCIELNPNYAHGFYGLAVASFWFGEAERVGPLNKKAIRLSPHDPLLWTFWMIRSIASFALDNSEQAIFEAKTAIQAKRDEFWPYLILATAYSSIDQIKQARAALKEAVRLKPNLSKEFLDRIVGNQFPAYYNKMMDCLNKAGLPE